MKALHKCLNCNKKGCPQHVHQSCCNCASLSFVLSIQREKCLRKGCAGRAQLNKDSCIRYFFIERAGELRIFYNREEEKPYKRGDLAEQVPQGSYTNPYEITNRNRNLTRPRQELQLCLCSLALHYLILYNEVLQLIHCCSKSFT